MSAGHTTVTELPHAPAVTFDEIPGYVVAAGMCATIATAFLICSDECRHWFILPVLACGVIVGIDAVAWLRGHLDILDPAALLGLFGVHFFFVAPLLHVSQDFWISEWAALVDTPPTDWRPWVGMMAFLNLAGLILYRYAMLYMSRPRKTPLDFQVDHTAFPALIVVSVAISAILQLRVYRHFGGIMSYITAFEQDQTDAFEGLGRVFMFSESLPLLLVMAFAVYARGKPLARSWIVLSLLSIVYLVLVLLFGGLRGSRANTIWSLFWAVGIIHYWVRPISKKIVVAGLVFLMLFMYGYGFYKWGGREATALLFDAKSRTEWVEESNRSAIRTLVFDMGRCDVQSYLLYRLTEFDDFDYGYGRTYYGAVALLVPESIWPNRPHTERKEGTEAQFGRGSFAPGRFESPWLYGLAGETMLNFGALAIPFSFIVLGVMTGYTRRLSLTLRDGDPRLLLLPLMISLCFIVLAWNSSNTVAFVFRNAGVSIAVVFLGTRLKSRGISPGPIAGAAGDV